MACVRRAPQLLRDAHQERAAVDGGDGSRAGPRHRRRVWCAVPRCCVGGFTRTACCRAHTYVDSTTTKPHRCCVRAGLAGYVEYPTQELVSGLLPLDALGQLGNEPYASATCITPGQGFAGFNASTISFTGVRHSWGGAVCMDAWATQWRAAHDVRPAVMPPRPPASTTARSAVHSSAACRSVMRFAPLLWDAPGRRACRSQFTLWRCSRSWVRSRPLHADAAAVPTTAADRITRLSQGGCCSWYLVDGGSLQRQLTGFTSTWHDREPSSPRASTLNARGGWQCAREMSR